MKYKISGYILFFIACVLFSFYRQFPGRTLAGYMEEEIAKKWPGISIQINKLRPSLPLGVKAESIALLSLGKTILKMDTPTCTFDIKTLFSQDWSISYKSSLLSGEISGTAILKEKHFHTILLETQVHNVQIKELQLGAALSNFKISGLSNGRVNSEIENGSIKETQSELIIKNLNVDSIKPIYGIEQLSFSYAEYNFNIKTPQVLAIEKIIMNGRQMDINAYGKIKLAKETASTRLNLQTRILLHPLFFMEAGNNFPVDVKENSSENAIFQLKISGSLQKPLITLDKGAT